MKWAVVDDRCLVAVLAASLDGAEAREELVHPERLGDVVVGALVEGVDLGGLLVTGRQHDHRDARPRTEPAEHVDAVHPGEAEVEDDDVGVVLCRGGQPFLAGGRHVHLVAVGPEADGQGPREADLVVDHEEPGHASASGRLSTMVVPAAGGVLGRQLAAHRDDEAAGHGQPQPDAGAVRGCRRGAGTGGTPRLARRAGCPGRCRRRAGRRGRRSAPASTRTGSPGGAKRRALSTMLAMARSSSTGSASTTGSVSGTSRWMRWPRSGSPLRAPPITSSRPTGSALHHERAGLDPTHVEQVPHQVVEPVGLLVDRLQQGSGLLVGERRRRPRAGSTTTP